MRTKLKVLRVKQGWTQKDVAEKIGITAPNYNLIETGKGSVGLPLGSKSRNFIA